MTNSWSSQLIKIFIINPMNNNSLSSIIDNPFPNIISIFFFIFKYLWSFVVVASATHCSISLFSHKNSYLNQSYLSIFFVLVQHHHLDSLKKWICKCIFFSFSFINHHCYLTISIIFVSFFCHYLCVDMHMSI